MSGSRFIQMPAQEGSYAVKVKNGAGWRSYDTARLQISVGMPYHEGEKFEATIAWARERFSRVIVCVNDTLQRFNMTDVADPYSLSFRQGREWVLRNMRCLETLPSFSLHHWEEWKALPDYAAQYARVLYLYDSDPAFRAAVDSNVADHWQRRKNPGGDFTAFHYASTQYLLEETAVFSLMYRQRAADVYPGTILIPAHYLKEKIVPGLSEGFGQTHHTRIDFSRRETPAPANSPARPGQRQAA